ncbi:MAG: hypothetical protein ACQR33_00540 [Candidatus Saccharibacteria bacterium]
MATDNDLTRGPRVPQEMLEQIDAGFPGGYRDDGDPLSYIAGVLALDEALGLSQPDNAVIIHPEFGGYALIAGRVVSPEQLAKLAQRLADAATDSGKDLSKDQATALDDEIQPLLIDWFEVRFDLPDEETGEPYQYHPAIHGKTITMRFFTEDELNRFDFICATVRVDGSIIQIDSAVARS